MSTRDRYYHDPVFHQLVDLLRHSLMESNYTATEIREAAMLAAEMHEYQHVRPLFISKESIMGPAAREEEGNRG